MGVELNNVFFYTLQIVDDETIMTKDRDKDYKIRMLIITTGDQEVTSCQNYTYQGVTFNNT